MALSLTTIPFTPDMTLARGAVSDILGQQSTAAENTAAAQGQGFAAQGNQAEAGAYGTAAGIAGQNAALTEMAGRVTELQQQREVAQTIGAQRAAVASSGFANSGSALAALTASTRQGYLTRQLTRMQTQMTQGGFLEQQAAATGEQQAAGIASQAALALQAAQNQTAATANTNAANETKALTSYIQGPPGTLPTPEEEVTMSALGPGNTPTVNASWYLSPYTHQYVYGDPAQEQNAVMQRQITNAQTGADIPVHPAIGAGPMYEGMTPGSVAPPVRGTFPLTA